MPAKARGLVSALRNVGRQWGDAASGIRKSLASNRNPMPVTGREVINSFMAQGLANAATGAVIGAGYGALSGGSMIEGAKQGVFYGGLWGTFSRMNTSRALAARQLGMDARGFGGGFRAMSRIADTPLETRAQMAREAEQAFRSQRRRAMELAGSLESGALTGRRAQEAITQLRSEVAALGNYAPTVEARTQFLGSMESRINALAQQLR